MQINHSAFSASCKDPFYNDASKLLKRCFRTCNYFHISISDFCEESHNYVFTKDAVLAREQANLPPGAMKSCSFTQCQKTTVWSLLYIISHMEDIQLHSIIFSCTKKVTFLQVLFTIFIMVLNNPGQSRSCEVFDLCVNTFFFLMLQVNKTHNIHHFCTMPSRVELPPHLCRKTRDEHTHDKFNKSDPKIIGGTSEVRYSLLLCPV